MHSDAVLWIVVGTAIAFDFTNGFHDTANSIATSVSTRAMSPRMAVIMAASLNFVGAFLSLAVAATIATGIVEATSVTLLTVFAGLIGAIAWNLADLVARAAVVVLARPDRRDGRRDARLRRARVIWSGLVEKVAVPALVAPVLAMVAAGLAILIAYRIVGRQSPGVVSRGFRLGQLASSALFSLSHGTNDAQKTMGIIFLALVANGNLSADADIPTWVIVSSATAIALGTYFGGWRIVRTMGSRIIKMDPAQGFAAQSAGAAVILAASHVGFPLSTTHVMSGAIMGAGAAKRLSAVRWGVAGNIVVGVGPDAAVLGGGRRAHLRRGADLRQRLGRAGRGRRRAAAGRAARRSSRGACGASRGGGAGVRLARRRGRADLRGDLGRPAGRRRDHHRVLVRRARDRRATPRRGARAAAARRSAWADAGRRRVRGVRRAASCSACRSCSARASTRSFAARGRVRRRRC